MKNFILFILGIIVGISGSTKYAQNYDLVKTEADVLSASIESNKTHIYTLTPTEVVAGEEKRIEIENLIETPIPSITEVNLPITATFTPSPTSIVITNSPTPTETITPTPSVTPFPVPVTKYSSQEINGFIDRFAGQYSIDPHVLRHIAVCESGFNPQSQSPNGLYAGLYQFSTSAWTNYRSQIGESTEATLRLNAEEAVQTAAYVLSVGKGNIWPNCLP